MSMHELTQLISPYFTEKTLIEFLHKKCNLKNISIEHIKFGEESKKGDSYLSTICRFVVEATGTNSSNSKEQIKFPVIVKFLPKNLGRRVTFRSLDFFENEAIFYNKVWAAFVDFKKSKQLEDSYNFVPDCLGAYIDGKHDYIALEDLSFKNYKCASRSFGLDLDHTKTILELFGKFHGMGLAFKDQQLDKFEEIASCLKETYFSERLRNWYKTFQHEQLFPVIRDAVQKELPEPYVDKINKLLNADLYSKLIKLCETRGSLAVITHGDVWVPNFLFKYDNKNSPQDIMLIDFQLARYASLSTDLTFFLYACLDDQLRNEHWDQLIQFYYNSLIATIKTFGSSPQIISYEALLDDIKKNALLGAGMAMEAITMSLLDDNDVADIDMIKGDEGVELATVWILKPYKEAEKRQRIAYMLKHAIDKGFI